MSVHLCGTAKRGMLTLEVDFSVGSEIVAITGLNGVGKTTLLRLLGGLISLDSGKLTVNDSVYDDALASQSFVPAHRRGLGMVFQDNVLMPFLSAVDNVAYPLTNRAVDKSVARKRAHDAMSDHGIGNLGAMMPHQLSGGQQQRVGLVRALIDIPRLVLLDEPFAALDADARRDVRVWLRTQLGQLPGSKFVVTHDSQDVEQLCDREITLVQQPNQQSGLRSVATIIR